MVRIEDLPVRRRRVDGRLRGALIGALVAADLDGALEVDFHCVWKLERLKMSVRQDRGTGAEVANLGKPAHQLGSDYTTVTIYKLDGSALSIVRNAVADQHVELIFVVLDGKDHSHRLADLDDPSDFTSPGAFAGLNLHPAANVVAREICPHDIQHVDRKRPESDSLDRKSVV